MWDWIIHSDWKPFFGILALFLLVVWAWVDATVLDESEEEQGSGH